MHSRGAAAVVAMLLAAGCTDANPQAQPTAQATAAPSPSAFRAPTTPPTSSPVAAFPVTASPTPSRDRISVTATDVAGVRIGTPADEAERQLTRLMGRPDTGPLPGCYGESGRYLTWDALTAYLSDGGDGGPATLSGWTVVSGRGSQRIALPYETAIGEGTESVMNKVPAAEGGVAPEGPNTGSFIISTTKAVGLFWQAAAEGAEVDEVSYKAESCD